MWKIAEFFSDFVENGNFFWTYYASKTVARSDTQKIVFYAKKKQILSPFIVPCAIRYLASHGDIENGVPRTCRDRKKYGIAKSGWNSQCGLSLSLSGFGGFVVVIIPISPHPVSTHSALNTHTRAHQRFGKSDALPLPPRRRISMVQQ